LSGYLLLQFWSYSFNILQDVYTHNGGVTMELGNIQKISKNAFLLKTRKEVCPTLDNYGQSCFVRNDLKKMKCVCKTQMMQRCSKPILLF
jgi:hypothetical protein